MKNRKATAIDNSRHKSKEILEKKSLYTMFFAVCVCFFLICLKGPLKPDLNTESPFLLSCTNDGMWVAGVQCDAISEIIRKQGHWESNVIDYLKKTVTPSDMIVEVGANLGYYTALFAKLIGKEGNGHIYAYEANKEVYDLANLTLKMNDLSDKVTLTNIAISDKVGIIDFVRTPIKKGRRTSVSAIISGARIGTKPAWGEELIRVHSTNLDTDLPWLSGVNILRLSAQGAEILILNGAKNLIEASPNLKILLKWNVSELNRYGDAQQLVKKMHSHGFRFFPIVRNGELGPELAENQLISYEIKPQDVVLIREHR